MSDPTIPLPFQPTTMTTAQLAAVSYLARYSGRTHTLYAYQLRQWCDGAQCFAGSGIELGRDLDQTRSRVHGSPARPARS